MQCSLLMKNIKHTLIILLLILVNILTARMKDMPVFGHGRFLNPGKTEQGMLRLGGGMGYDNIDGDSLHTTSYGIIDIGFSKWLSLNARYPYYTDERAGLLKAGPGDMTFGAEVYIPLKFLGKTDFSIFSQVSVPTGYKGQHVLFESYTSSDNDYSIGIAFSSEQYSVFTLTGNFSAVIPEREGNIVYNPALSLGIALPLSVDLDAVYFTDLSQKPPQFVEFSLSRAYKFLNFRASFNKDFSKPDISWGYNMSMDVSFRLFSPREGRKAKAITLVDQTDWEKYPDLAKEWDLLQDSKKVFVSPEEMDSGITVEFKVLDYLEIKQKKDIIPVLAQKESITGRFLMNVKVIDADGDIISERNITGEKSNKTRILTPGSDDRQYTQYLDYSEKKEMKMAALINLHTSLNEFVETLRKGKF